MKKAALVFGIIAIVLGFTFTPIGTYFYKFLRVQGKQGNYSQFNFKSIRGTYEIFIDNTLKETVEEGKSKEIILIEPGIRQVKVVRKSEIKDFFHQFERNISFLPNAAVEMEWDAGPTLESSSGVLKYFTKIVKQNGSEVFVSTFPDNAKVEFDSRRNNNNVFEVLDTATHTIRVSGNEGFDSKFVELNLTNESTKRVLTNLKLIIEVFLYKQPFIAES